MIEAMRRFLLLALISGIVFPVMSNAEGTWIRISVIDFSNMSSGSLGRESCDKDDVCGMATYVDASSIAKSGSFVYFNKKVVLINRNGDRIKKGPISGVGWQANCSKKLLKGPKGSWRSFDRYNGLGQFVCR